MSKFINNEEKAEEISPIKTYNILENLEKQDSALVLEDSLDLQNQTN